MTEKTDADQKAAVAEAKAKAEAKATADKAASEKAAAKSAEPDPGHDGTLTTDEGVEVEAVSPAIPDPVAVGADLPNNLSVEEQINLAGDLEPGEEGWLPIDDEGRPTGPAKRGLPPEGQKVVAVQVPVAQVAPALMTTSGAPLTDRMNPNPTIENTGKGQRRHDYSDEAVDNRLLNERDRRK